jgi:hypothetical protein
VPFDDVMKVTLVPGFTQNTELPLALGKLGVAVAPFMPSRLMSTEQEPEAAQVLSAVQRLWGFGSAQTYLFFPWAAAEPDSRQIEAQNISRTARVQRVFISSSFHEVKGRRRGQTKASRLRRPKLLGF